MVFKRTFRIPLDAAGKTALVDAIAEQQAAADKATRAAEKARAKVQKAAVRAAKLEEKARAIVAHAEERIRVALRLAATNEAEVQIEVEWRAHYAKPIMQLWDVAKGVLLEGHDRPMELAERQGRIDSVIPVPAEKTAGRRPRKAAAAGAAA